MKQRRVRRPHPRKPGKRKASRMAYVPDNFREPPAPLPPVRLKEMWFQETGPQAFAVGISRRSWFFCLVGLAIFTLYACSSDEFYGGFVRSHHGPYATLNFLKWIAALFIFGGVVALSLWG